jgi:hypothetical protein
LGLAHVRSNQDGFEQHCAHWHCENADDANAATRINPSAHLTNTDEFPWVETPIEEPGPIAKIDLLFRGRNV